jgi:hypothetical protein
MDTLVPYDYDGGQTRRYFKAKEVGTFSDISVIALYEGLHESSMIVPRSQRIEGIFGNLSQGREVVGVSCI